MIFENDRIFLQKLSKGDFKSIKILKERKHLRSDHLPETDLDPDLKIKDLNNK